VGTAGLGLRLPQRVPDLPTAAAVAVVVVLVLVSTRALLSGALLRAAHPERRPPGEGRHTEPPVHATLALLPRTRAERRLFTVVGVTAGLCEEWLYRGFLLAVVSAVAGGAPTAVLVAVAGAAFGLAHAYQGTAGVLTTGVLGAVLAALYLGTGSLLLPVVLHALIDLRFLLVPARVLPAGSRLAS
jgi:membrane protease YdiL (CAAX protease family)